jgi:HAD superfamily hydrolase (TIGR01549 family)
MAASHEDTVISFSPKEMSQDDETEILRPGRAIQYRGVLLDIDGTLVDSNDAHAHAWVEALVECRHRTRFAQVRPLIGMGGDKLLPKVAGIDGDSPEGKEVSKLRSKIFLQKYAPELQPCAGAAALLKAWQNAGIHLIVASSAKKDELQVLLRICGGEALIDSAVSADDADRSKPSPDILTAALKRIRLPANEVVMLGDTPYDIEAANRAGLRTIALRCGGWRDVDLAGAIEIFDAPRDLLQSFICSQPVE